MKNVMKYAGMILAVLLMASCNQKQLEQEIATLQQENEELRQQAIEKDNSLGEFFESMAQIRDNLNEIKVRQNLIAAETRDRDGVGQDVRQQIDSDLNMISELMEDNRRRIARLNRQVRESNVKIEEFEVLIASLNSEIEDRNVEISVLRDNLSQLNIHNEALASTIEQLETENVYRQNVIDEKVHQLNTAYFVYGTRRQLQEQEIIDRQGGILGLGRTTVVNPGASREYFTRVDITQLDKVQIPASKLKLVSVHPADSYMVEVDEEEKVAEIVIENPEKFWSNTRYLIVSID
ncbi:MAG: hypothetical protein ACK4VN_15800 [Bacteroidales bacterium]